MAVLNGGQNEKAIYVPGNHQMRQFFSLRPWWRAPLRSSISTTTPPKMLEVPIWACHVCLKESMVFSEAGASHSVVPGKEFDHQDHGGCAPLI